MKLITKALADRIPRLYSQDGKGDDATIYTKFFTPWSNWTWFVTEADFISTDEDGNTISKPLKEWNPNKYQSGDDVMFFGLVQGHEEELGYFLLSQLVDLSGPYDLGVERDKSFDSTRRKTIQEVRR